MATPLPSVFDSKVSDIREMKAPVSARLSMESNGQWLMTYSKDVGEGVPQPGSHKLYASNTKEGDVMLYMIPSNSNGKAYLITPNSIAGIQPLLDSYKKGSFRPTTVTVTNSSDGATPPPPHQTNGVNDTKPSLTSLPLVAISKSSSVTMECDPILGVQSASSVIKSLAQKFVPSNASTVLNVNSSNNISTGTLSEYTKQSSKQFPSIRPTLTFQQQNSDRTTDLETPSTAVPVVLVSDPKKFSFPTTLSSQRSMPFIIPGSVRQTAKTAYLSEVNSKRMVPAVPNHRTNVRITRPTKGGIESAGTLRLTTPSGFTNVNRPHFILRLPSTTADSVLIKTSLSTSTGNGNSHIQLGNGPRAPFLSTVSTSVISVISSAQAGGVFVNSVMSGVHTVCAESTCSPVTMAPTPVTTCISSCQVNNIYKDPLPAQTNSLHQQDDDISTSNDISATLQTGELEQDSPPCSIKIDSVFSLIGSTGEDVRNSETDTCSEASCTDDIDSVTEKNENNSNVAEDTSHPLPDRVKKKKKKRKRKAICKSQFQFTGLRRALESMECFVVLSRFTCHFGELDEKWTLKRSAWEKLLPPCTVACRKNEVRKLMDNRIKRSIRIKKNLEKKQKIQSATASKVRKGIMTGLPVEKIKLIDETSLGSPQNSTVHLNTNGNETQCALEIKKQLLPTILKSVLRDHPGRPRKYSKQSILKISYSGDHSYTEKVDHETAKPLIVNVSPKAGSGVKTVLPRLPNSRLNDLSKRSHENVKIIRTSDLSTGGVDDENITSLTKTIGSSIQTNPQTSFITTPITKIGNPPVATHAISTSTSVTNSNIVPVDSLITKTPKFVHVKMGGKSILYPILGNTVQPRAYMLDGKGNTTVIDRKANASLTQDGGSKITSGKLHQHTVVGSKTTTEGTSNVSSSPKTVMSPKPTILRNELSVVPVKKEPVTVGYGDDTSSSLPENPIGIKIKSEPKRGYPDEVAEKSKSSLDEREDKTVSLKRTISAEDNEAHEQKIKRLKEMLEKQERELEEFMRKQSERPPVNLDLENM